MSDSKDLNYVKGVLKEVDILLQMSEEASELSQAAAKRARVLVGRNPTPVTEPESYQSLLEEYADVKLCAEALLSTEDLKNVNVVMREKLNRWVSRIKKSDIAIAARVLIDGEEKEIGDVVYGLSDGVAWRIVGINPEDIYSVDAVLASDESVRKQLKESWLSSRSNPCVCADGPITVGSEAYIKDPVSVKGRVMSISRRNGFVKVGIRFTNFHDVVYVRPDEVALKNPDSYKILIEDVLPVLSGTGLAEGYCFKRKIGYESIVLKPKDYVTAMRNDVQSRLQSLANGS